MQLASHRPLAALLAATSMPKQMLTARPRTREQSLQKLQRGDRQIQQSFGLVHDETDKIANP